MPRSKYLLRSIEALIDRLAPVQQGGRNWSWLQTILTVLSAIAAILAVIIASQTLSTTSKSGKEMASLLEGLNSSFEETRLGLIELPRTIDKFDSTVTGMSASLGNMAQHLDDFANSLEDYKEVIDSTIAAYNRHLELLNEQQKQLNRRSDLQMRFEVTVIDSGFWEIQPNVLNYGDAPTDFYHFYLVLPENLGFCEGSYSVRSATGDRNNYTFVKNQPMGFPAFPGEGKAWSEKVKGTRFILRNPPPEGAIELIYHIAFQHGNFGDTVSLAPNGEQ